MTISQFATLHPDKRCTCYDWECVVQDGEIEVAVSMISAKVRPPSKFVSFDESSKTFEQTSTKVNFVCDVPTTVF